MEFGFEMLFLKINYNKIKQILYALSSYLTYFKKSLFYYLKNI